MQYSPARRTALVFSGTGAHGAYHAGVIRAVQEAGVKIDIVAGHGAGAGAALLAAIDGGARLWEADGIWRSGGRDSFYQWTARVRLAAALAVLLVLALAVPLLLLLAGIVVFPAPRTAMAVVVAVMLIAGAAWAVSRWRPLAGKRRPQGGWWNPIGAPLDAEPARHAFIHTIWQLIRGAAGDVEPSVSIAGRRYAEVLAENLGQPGFRELMIVATDLDSRSDVVAAMLSEPYQRDFIAPRAGGDRRAEALDLSGAGRDHAIDLMAAALTPPVGCDACLVTFAADGFWRGETHRLCDRPGSIARLLEELAAVGVSQVIVATAVPVNRAPHRLRSPRLDVRSLLGEYIAAAECTSLHDALGLARVRFEGVYVICPSHNPLGPFDVAGAYDPASDRRHSTGELIARGYEDAYHQFIEPVVGASGEQLSAARQAQ